MESKYDLIVFDLDGTLIDTLDDISSALNKAIEPFGVGPHTTETVRSFVGDGTWQLVERALEDKAAQHIDEATKNFKEIYSQNLVHMTQPYERIFDLLRFVQYPMAVATNKPEAMAKTILDKLGMAGFFLGLVGGDTLPTRKPDPAMLFEICARLGADPKRSVMVGDSAQDMMAAKAAGMKTVAVSWGFHSIEGLKEHSPDEMAESTLDLLRILNS